MENKIPKERKKVLDSLFEAFAIVAEGAFVYLCDMKYDYSRWSKTAVELFDLPAEYMYEAGKIWEEHIHPEDRENYRREIEAIFSGLSFGHDLQYRAKKPDGNYDVCTCRGVVILDQDGVPEYFGGVIRNHGLQSQLDELTGLRNQYSFFEALQTNIRLQNRIRICMIGIRKFTEINEVYGYHFGNMILQKFGRYLMDHIGSRGSVYRLDGTKFAVVFKDNSIEEIQKIYKNLREHSREGLCIDNQCAILDLNAGLITLDNFSINDQTVYACLNFAYGESKDRKQGEMVEFYNNLTEENRQRIEKLHVIRASITQEYRGFYLLYQPVVDARSEKLIGAEALLRWRSEEYGMVPPDHFIPLLERDPLFPDLGRWILKRALTDAKEILMYCP